MSGNVAFNGYAKGTYNETSMPGFGLTIGWTTAVQVSRPAGERGGHLRDCTINSPGGADMDGMVVDSGVSPCSWRRTPWRRGCTSRTPPPHPDLDARCVPGDLGSLKRVVPMEAGDELSGSITANVALKGRMSATNSSATSDFTAKGSRSCWTWCTAAIPRLTRSAREHVLRLQSAIPEAGPHEGTIGRSDLQANGRFDNYLQWWLQDSTLAGSFNVRSNS